MKPMLKSQRYPSHRRNVWQMPTLLLLLASCAMAAGCQPRVIVKTDFCTGWKPIIVSPDDVLTDPTAKQIFAHDEHGVAIKCWKKP